MLKLGGKAAFYLTSPGGAVDPPAEAAERTSDVVLETFDYQQQHE